MGVTINEAALRTAARDYAGAKPFDHLVIDDLFPLELARALEAEIPAFDADCWHEYNNPIEIKKTCNSWLAFPALTYQTFSFFNSQRFIELVAEALGLSALYPDPGLNGGGWHAHACGGKLNTHLDYSLHPKLGLQRKLNLIVYLTEGWREAWGGELGLWEQDAAVGGPGRLVKQVAPLFNRAVLFDTTQQSWHGLPAPIRSPAGVLRKSIAVYYLTDPPVGVETRGKALFAPTEAQRGDPEVLELIRKRASVDSAASTYRR